MEIGYYSAASLSIALTPGTLITSLRNPELTRCKWYYYYFYRRRRMPPAHSHCPMPSGSVYESKH
eukprot:scaffold6062_cov74-Cyclotella_meneghiniana.AAC.9